MKYYERSWGQTEVFLNHLLLGFNLHCCFLCGKVSFNSGVFKKPGGGEVGWLQLRVPWSTTCCSCGARELGMASAFLNGWEKIKRRILRDIWKLCKFQISASINKVWLEHGHTHPFTDCLWLHLHYNPGLKSCTEIIRPKKYSLSGALQPVSSWAREYMKPRSINSTSFAY